MQYIGITGGTGLIGKHLSSMLMSKGYKVIIFSRGKSKESNSNLSYAYWNPATTECDVNALQKLNAIVHLAGAGIADKRWTKKRKDEILYSRVRGTEFLVTQLKEHAINCKTMIGTSAIGYYGSDRSDSSSFTEDMPASKEFLSTVCVEWEKAEWRAKSFLRMVIFRVGIVLGKESVAYAKLSQPVSYGVVPILGSGKQMVSWIHIDDLCRMMLYALENEKLSGIYNAVGPAPVTHRELMKSIAKEKGGIKIPVPVPSLALKIMLGEMSGEVLKSATVIANKILEAGFTFRYNTVRDAVHALENQ